MTTILQHKDNLGDPGQGKGSPKMEEESRAKGELCTWPLSRRMLQSPGTDWAIPEASGLTMSASPTVALGMHVTHWCSHACEKGVERPHAPGGQLTDPEH